MAYLKVKNMNLGIDDYFYKQYNPSKTIDYGAMAVHNIALNDLHDCPPTGMFCLPEKLDKKAA